MEIQFFDKCGGSVWEYLEWLSKYSYLALPSLKLISLYLILATVLCLVRILIYLRFFHSPNTNQENVLGLFSKIMIFILAIFMGPFAEEIIFRGPILWFVQRHQYFYMFLAFFVSTLIFRAEHAWEGRIFDAVKRSVPDVYNSECGAVFYGGLVIFTSSLWPAIFLHLFWNIFAMIGVFVLGKKKLDRYAKLLQR